LPRLDDTGNEQLKPIRGNPPSLVNVPSGCAFHPRCDFAREERCSTEVPQLRSIDSSTHTSACHFAEELREVGVQELREGVSP
jgi:peptide/nickel transport system ATP-binding protein